MSVRVPFHSDLFLALLRGAPLIGQGNLPRIATSGVVNAGDYMPVLAPGMHMSVFGSNLAAITKIAETAPSPEVLDGVSGEVVHAERLMRAPRLLTKTMDGRGEAILLHPDDRLVSEQAPALPGEVVAGLGALTPPVAAGARAGDGQSAPRNETEPAPEVLVAGSGAEVLWSGPAPYYAGH